MKKSLSLGFVTALSLFSVSAFAAPNFEQQASVAASETIKYQRQASLAKQQSMDACRQSKDALFNAMKDLTPDEKKAFMKEYRYQMRQQVAKLGRDEVYDEFVCGANKPPKAKRPNDKKKKNKAKQSVLERRLSGGVLVQTDKKSAKQNNGKDWDVFGDFDDSKKSNNSILKPVED